MPLRDVDAASQWLSVQATVDALAGTEDLAWGNAGVLSDEVEQPAPAEQVESALRIGAVALPSAAEPSAADRADRGQPAITHSAMLEVSEARPSYRIQGELERTLSLEPLPPTPIVNGARERLQALGAPDELIVRLQEYTSSFRYDLVPQRVERLVKRGYYILENPDGCDEMLVPGFSDFNSRGDGQCGDIAWQLGRILHSTGFMDELNKYAKQQGAPEIKLMLAKGTSATHFLKVDQEHLWLELYSGTDFGDGVNIDYRHVTIDPSFQHISNPDNNSYTIISRISDPLTIDSVYPVRIVEPLLWWDEGVLSLDNCGLTIGVSADKNLAYVAGVAKNVEAGSYHPTLLTILPNGSFGPGRIVRDQERIQDFGRTATVQLTPEQLQEMAAIMDSLTRMPIIKDQAAARLLEEQKIVCKMRN
jgi:hypothetical protein